MQFKGNYKKVNNLDLSVDYTKVVTQLYKPLKINLLLDYNYGVPCLRCCMQIGDAFDGNIVL